MLSMSNLKNAQAAISYYENDNYYTKGDEEAKEQSGWFGKGAKALSLKGEVSYDDFTKVLEGKLPDGKELGRYVDGERQHAPGTDLTFSAPKSVSILAEVFDDKKLLDAHDKAVLKTLDYIEKNIAETRIYDGKSAVNQGEQKIVVGIFQHDTSRNLDPQLHTHCVIANMVQGKEGKWRSLENSNLFKNKMLLGSIYRSYLAKDIKDLGYDLRYTRSDGCFEINGVSESVIDRFSSRSQEIKEALEKLDYQNAITAAKMTLMTRQSKQEVDRSLLEDKWKEMANSVEFKPEQVKGYQNDKPSEKTQTEEFNLNPVLNHITERQSVFSHGELIKEALNLSMGKATLEGVEKAFKDAQKTGGLVSLNGKQFTTKEIISLEKNIISQMQQEKNKHSKISTYTEMKQTLDPDKFLNESQKGAIKATLGSKDLFVGIQGYAGTGKTTMLNKLRELSEEKGYQVIGLAPTGSATHELSNEAKIQSKTLQSFLAQYDGVAKDRLTDKGREELRTKYKNSILVVDESSFISLRQANDLMKIAKEIDLKKVIFVGDKKQLDGVETGKPFEQLQKAGMKTAIMDNIMRQKDNSQLKEAVLASIGGDVKKALSKVNSIQEVDEKKQSLTKKIVDDWLKLEKSVREKAAILVQTNQLKHKVNQEIKELFEITGTKSHTQNILEQKNMTQIEKRYVEKYEKGDIVHFNREYKNLGIQKGQMLKIKEVDTNKNIVHLENGKKDIEWKPYLIGKTKSAVEVYQERNIKLSQGDKVRFTKNNKEQGIMNSQTAHIEKINQESITFNDGKKEITLAKNDPQMKHLDYGWASTAHAFQGKTVDRVLAVLDSSNKHLTTQKSFYVEISRARHEASLYVDNIEKVQKTLEQKTGERIAALDINKDLSFGM